MTRILKGCLLVTVLALVQPAFAGVDEDEVPFARLVMEKSGVTASVAIETALGKYPGIVYEYELEEDDDRFVHEIEVADLESKRTHKIAIDAQSGEIVEVKSSRASSWFNESDDVKAARVINEHRLPLLGALEKATSGKNDFLTEIEFEHKQGINFFKIELVDSNGEKDVLVDIESQDIIPSFGK